MVGGVIIHGHWIWTNKPPWRLLLLQLLPLCKQVWLLPLSHKLVQLGTKGGGGGGGGGGGSSNLQRFKANNPLALKGGGHPMVVGHCFRLVRKHTGASAKRNENQSSSSSRKKQKTYVSYEFKGRGHYYQGQGRAGASSQIG